MYIRSIIHINYEFSIKIVNKYSYTYHCLTINKNLSRFLVLLVNAEMFLNHMSKPFYCYKLKTDLCILFKCDSFKYYVMLTWLMCKICKDKQRLLLLLLLLLLNKHTSDFSSLNAVYFGNVLVYNFPKQVAFMHLQFLSRTAYVSKR